MNKSKKDTQLEDRFNRLMFGNKLTKENDISSSTNNSPLFSALNNVDLEDLLMNIDKLMNSVNELKPLYKNLSPIIELVMNKRKE